MSYQKLLLEYAQTLSNFEKAFDETGGKRLRWEKDEAMGNSKFRWTGTKVRYAHVVNRNLQMNLDKNVSVWAKTHGSKCNEIESKQREFWVAQSKRNDRVGTSYLDTRGNPTLKIFEPLVFKRRVTSPQHLSATATPFSTASDFSIYRRPYDPTEHKMLKQEKSAARKYRVQSSRSTKSSVSDSSFGNAALLQPRGASAKTLGATKEPLLSRRRYSSMA